MLCYAMLRYATLCYATLRYAMLCYAMLCYAMLCYALIYPCYAMFLHFYYAMIYAIYHAQIGFVVSYHTLLDTFSKLFSVHDYHIFLWWRDISLTYRST